MLQAMDDSGDGKVSLEELLNHAVRSRPVRPVPRTPPWTPPSPSPSPPDPPDPPPWNPAKGTQQQKKELLNHADTWEGSPGSSDDAESVAGSSSSTEDTIRSSVQELVKTKLWPLSVDQTDIDVIVDPAEGSVILVLSLPEPV